MSDTSQVPYHLRHGRLMIPRGGICNICWVGHICLANIQDLARGAEHPKTPRSHVGTFEAAKFNTMPLAAV